ncbi:hypothetical protein J1N35_012896 [Gossypium stocksii]|uniref:Uncharacterized protein n=1 Tax=Gossypium stocksii TaxID=47602 RepID=A0A9D4A7E1_9ROSI|nr:hypothetical protein J1N35_012896 [Gossypium stocksii]
MAGFSRIPLNHRKDTLSVEDDSEDEYWLEIMGEEEECLILGQKECRMFFLSAWKPKVEEEHLNFNSSNDKFGLGFNPYPSPLPPLQPFPEAVINNPEYSILNPESMEALVCNENWLETPKGNDEENHEPTQTTDKGKRKSDVDTWGRKKSKPSNCEEVISTEDSNNNDGNPSFDKWMEPQCSSSKCVGKKAEVMEASVRSRNRSESSIENEPVGEISIAELNHGKNIEDVSSGDSSSDNDESDQVQSSSSESDIEITLKEQGSWFEQDIKAYLLSEFTKKENELIDKWQKNELNGLLIPFLNCLRDLTNFQMYISTAIHLAHK